MAVNPHTLEKINAYWAHDLAADSEMLSAVPGVVCTVQHNHPGIQLFRRGSTVIIASPPGKSEIIRNAVQGSSPDAVFSAPWLQSVLGNAVELILGPAQLNYADAENFRTEQHESVRSLSEADSESYRSLISSLNEVEIAESGATAGKFPAFGSFCDGVLCGVASYQVWKSSIAHITVATHSAYRRRGFARAAVQALAVDALERGLILQWRALAWNTNSLRLAAALGFEHYASTLFVRLKSSTSFP